MATKTAQQPAQQSQNGKKQLAPMDTLRDLFNAAKGRLAEVAPRHMNVDRLIRLMLLACGRSPKILACTSDSVLQFCLKCAETGLEPIGAGGCWPIPYGTTLTFIPDYRGLVHCAIRAGAITSAKAEIVREGDDFTYELGLDPKLRHIPARGDRGALEAAYCRYKLPDGTMDFVVMDAVEIQGIRKRSKAADSGPWVTDDGEMWKKTVVRRAMKPFAGLNASLDAAMAADDAVTGVVDREPVPMPRAVGESAPKPQELAEGEVDEAGVPIDPKEKEAVRAEGKKAKDGQLFDGGKRDEDPSR